MYRPEDWLELVKARTYYSVSTELYDKQEVELGRECFIRGMEAGADAMLEAIKCIGLNFTCYPFHMGSMDVFDYEQSLEGKNGWLVFIPEEQE